MKISSFFKPLSFLPALALMYMIYSFSGETGDLSSQTSYKVSVGIVKVVDMVTSQNWEDWQIQQHAEQIHGLVRKTAHMTEYFLLAVAVSFPLYVYGVRGILLMILAGGFCVAFAIGDEYHQSMVPGRGPSWRDVRIDSIGVLIGVILVRLLGWSGRMAITGPAYERQQKKQQRLLDEREEELRQREQALRRRELNQRRRVRRPADAASAQADRRTQQPSTAGTQQHSQAGAQQRSSADRPAASAQSSSARSGYGSGNVPQTTRVAGSGTAGQASAGSAARRSSSNQPAYSRRQLKQDVPVKRYEESSDTLADDMPLFGKSRKK